MSSTSPTHLGLEQSPVFPVLDTLRAVGALAVLTTHSTFQSGDYVGHGVWGTLLSRLDIGVAVFFVLSGFLLSRPYLARAAAGLPHPTTGRYYWKRLLRIYPVYAVTVVLALALIDDNDGIGVGAWAAGWLESLKPLARYQRAFDVAGGLVLVLSGLYMLNAYFFVVPALAA